MNHSAASLADFFAENKAAGNKLTVTLKNGSAYSGQVVVTSSDYVVMPDPGRVPIVIPFSAISTISDAP